MLMSLPWSYWLGFGLLLWLLYDLIRGVAYLWHPYAREEQPYMYWLTMLIWALVAASCFVYPYWPYV